MRLLVLVAANNCCSRSTKSATNRVLVTTRVPADGAGFVCWALAATARTMETIAAKSHHGAIVVTDPVGARRLKFSACIATGIVLRRVRYFLTPALLVGAMSSASLTCCAPRYAAQDTTIAKARNTLHCSPLQKVVLTGIPRAGEHWCKESHSRNGTKVNGYEPANVTVVLSRSGRSAWVSCTNEKAGLVGPACSSLRIRLSSGETCWRARRHLPRQTYITIAMPSSSFWITSRAQPAPSTRLAASSAASGETP